MNIFVLQKYQKKLNATHFDRVNLPIGSNVDEIGFLNYPIYPTVWKSIQKVIWMKSPEQLNS